jgi:ligand-binding sensor domain-containing protein/signal transduction histidine kinase
MILNNKRLKPLFCIVLVFMAVLSSPGMVPKLPLRFEQISIQQGLSQSVVSAILQDKKGYMWFGTQDGLNKYDGYNFTIYRNISFNEKSLSFNEITSLYEDSRGNLWVGTARGLNRFLPGENAFQRFFDVVNNPQSNAQASISSITEDKFGNIIVGTMDGIKVISPVPFTPDSYYHAKSFKVRSGSAELSGNWISKIFKDRYSTIWVLTNKGINRLIDHSSNNYDINYTFENFSNSAKKIYSINPLNADFDENGNIWLSDRSKLYVFNPIKDELREPDFSGLEVDQTTIPFAKEVLCENNNVWLYSLSKGLIRLSVSSETRVDAIDYFKQNPPQSNFNEEVKAIYVNKENNENMLWVGTEGNSLFKVNLKGNFFTKYTTADGFQSNFITSIFKDHNGKIWVGSHSGIGVLDRKTRQVKTYLKDERSHLISEYVCKIFEDSRKTIWVGTEGGLLRYDSASDSFKEFILKESRKSDQSGRSVKFCGDIFEDSKGFLWFGFANGVYKVDPIRNTQTFFRHINNNPRSFLPGLVYSIAEDVRGNIWFGTTFGLCKYNEGTNDFMRFKHDPFNRKSIPANLVLGLLTTQRGELWIGTTQGLSRVDFKMDKISVETYTTSDGLANDFVYGMLEDKNGNLWISTNRGISKFDVGRKRFRNYQEKDGLQSLEFNSYAYHKAKDGEMFFGGIAGFNSFYPEEEPLNDYIPPVYLSSLALHGKSLRLDSLFGVCNYINLSHNENSLLFEFAALGFKHPEANQYAYQMEGLDNKWINLKTRRFVSFNNLSPGDYIFRVRASNDDGVWNNKGFAVRIKINPPFYLTIWFYLILVSLVILIIILINNYQVRRRVKSLMLLEKVRNEEQEKIRKKTAEDFHDELGNKLTRISLLAELAKAKGIDQNTEISQILSKISDNANTLFYGTKDLIWSINPNNDTFYELAVRLKDFGDELFDNSNVTFKISGICESFRNIILPMDTARHIVLIFKEAMTNALKHAHSSNVTLTFDENGHELRIELTDDGKGFYSSNGNGKNDGNGLSNMKSRAKKINSELSINAVPGFGTMVELRCHLAERVFQKQNLN